MVNIKYILVYLLIINLISFALFYTDKQKAKKDRWRIKESTLHIVGFMGGIIGSIAAMILFRHKTKKTKFEIITIIATGFDKGSVSSSYVPSGNTGAYGVPTAKKSTLAPFTQANAAADTFVQKISPDPNNEEIPLWIKKHFKK